LFLSSDNFKEASSPGACRDESREVKRRIIALSNAGCPDEACSITPPSIPIPLALIPGLSMKTRKGTLEMCAFMNKRRYFAFALATRFASSKRVLGGQRYPLHLDICSWRGIKIGKRCAERHNDFSHIPCAVPESEKRPAFPVSLSSIRSNQSANVGPGTALPSVRIGRSGIFSDFSGRTGGRAELLWFCNAS